MVSLRIGVTGLAKIQELADDNGISRSEVIRCALSFAVPDSAFRAFLRLRAQHLKDGQQ